MPVRFPIKSTAARFHNRVGRIFSLALVILALLLSQNPGSAEIMTLEQWLDLGWDYYNTSNTDEAFNTFLEAADQYPDSAEIHLALGEIYIDMGIVDRGRNELMTSLQLDDESPIASRTHYIYALSIREEDTWNALLHLDRAHNLGGTPNLQFEIAHQIRFCHLLIQMPEKASSGQIVIHYADYTLTDDAAGSLAQDIEGSLFLLETFCYTDITKPIHIFLYSSERAIRAEIMLEEDDTDPVHREYHIPCADDMDFLPMLSLQMIEDLQSDMNRHSGAEWVAQALPTAVTGLVPWGDAVDPDTQDFSGIDCDDAVRALESEAALVDLQYLLSEEYAEYIPDIIARAEMGSFLRWVRQSYDRSKFLEIITQPNLDIIIDEDIDQIQRLWLAGLANSPSLLSDPELAEQWVKRQPLSVLAGDPELPLSILKEGLSLYLSGEKISGLWEINRSLQLDPGLALGYYTLGWIAVNDGNWERAKEQLGMAVRLFEKPLELAWCYAMLAPIYLHEGRLDLAQASLDFVVTYADSQSVRDRAYELLTRANHIIALQPSELDRTSYEFDLMRDFFQEWNRAANSGENLYPYISEIMDDTSRSELAGFFEPLRDKFPSIVFNHAVQKVGLEGSAILVKLNVQGVLTATQTVLPSEFEPFSCGGWLLYFKVMPTEDGWKILDWEDGWFPLSSDRDLIPMNPDFEISE